MGRSHRVVVAAALSVALGAIVPAAVGGVPAQADTSISWRAEGTVTTLGGNVPGSVVDVQIGDPVVVDIEIDPGTPAGYVSEHSAGYLGAVLGATVTIGGIPALAATGGNVTLVDDSPTSTNGEQGFLDQYTITLTGVTQLTPLAPGDPWITQLGLSSRGITPPTALSGVALSAVPPAVSAFGAAAFAVSFKDLSGCAEDDFDIGCWRVSSFSAAIDRIVGDGPDADGDGVADAIAAVDGSGAPIARGFDDGSGTTGRITAGGGILVEDAPSPQGVRITTTGPASVSVCGFSLSLSADSDVVVTCGSIHLDVAAGTATLELSDGRFVTVPDGGRVVAERLGNGDSQVSNTGEIGVDITRAGVTTVVAPGTVAFTAPQSKRDCKSGWADYGMFRNHGQCVSFVVRR